MATVRSRWGSRPAPSTLAATSLSSGETLGPFQVFAISFAFISVAVGILVVPASAHVPDLIAAGLVLAGGLYFLAMLTFDRKPLETEPDAVDILERLLTVDLRTGQW